MTHLDADPAREHHDGCLQSGLYEKYDVRRTDGSDAPGGRHHGCRYFVLDLDHDPSARHAARIFAEDVERSRPRLSAELLELLATLGQVPLLPECHP
jgi:hypothetical protein